MKRLGLVLALLLTSLMPASADYVIRDGNNALQTIKAFNCLGVICPQMTPADGNGTAFGTSTNPFYVNTVNSAGFTAASTGTPISATTGGATGTLPAGAVVVATNVGATNGAYCALGAAATTASQYIAPNGGWFAFTVGVATQLTCATSTSTTTVNMTGGSGLATGTGGGGGGGSGGGGAIYGPTAAGSAAANPPVLMGGTVDGTATGNVDNWKVLAGIGYINCSNCSGSGISVPFAGSIGSNGTPGGFKDASSNFQPLLGDVTNGEWVSVKASVLPTGAATSALQTTGNTALGTINTTLGTPMQSTGGSVTANAGTNLNTSLLALEAGGNLASLVTQIGAVTASPTQYTIGDRLKTINTTIGTPMQATGGSVTANIGTPGIGITPTDRTITSATGSSQTVMASNASRHGLLIEDTGNANCGINPTGGTAVIGGAGTLTLVPNGSYSPVIPTLSAVTAICTSGQPLYAQEQ